VTSHRERNDRRAPFRGPRKGPPSRPASGDGAAWIWGAHAVEAALCNPERAEISAVLATAEKAEIVKSFRRGLTVEIVAGNEIARRLPPGAAHQGMAVMTPPLEGVDLEDLADPPQGVLVMLDQITDPQNVGAIFRSAAALGARGLIVQDRHSPPFGGALCKAAAGAVDRLPAARVVNLARALDRLSDLGWAVVGLSGGAEKPLDEVLDGRPTVLVLGSEGEGMRRLVSEHCDEIGRIPMPGGFESLNVSAAAAIALYEAQRKRP